MPTFKISVLKHQLRRDGKYPVSIRITHNRASGYLKTGIYVLRKQISTDFSHLKDLDVARRIDRDIISYEKLLLRELSSNMDRFSTKEIISYIEKHIATDGGENIDFIAFPRQHSTSLKASGRRVCDAI